MIDSRVAGLAMGLMAMTFAGKVKSGAVGENGLDIINNLIKNNWQTAIVTDLENLLKLEQVNMPVGKGLWDEILDFKPVFTLANGEGRFRLASREKSIEEAISEMENLLSEKIDQVSMSPTAIGISHSRLLEESKKVQSTLESSHSTGVHLVGGSVILCAYFGPHSIDIAVQFEV